MRMRECSCAGKSSRCHRGGDTNMYQVVSSASALPILFIIYRGLSYAHCLWVHNINKQTARITMGIPSALISFI